MKNTIISITFMRIIWQSGKYGHVDVTGRYFIYNGKICKNVQNLDQLYNCFHKITQWSIDIQNWR